MKILGIGTDILNIARVERLYQQYPEGLTRRILSQPEKMVLKNINHPAAFIAKRFSAKEAIAKALGTGFRGAVSLTQIEITNDTQGAPHVIFHKETKDYVEKIGCHEVKISLSDEKDYCMAFAIALG